MRILLFLSIIVVMMPVSAQQALLINYKPSAELLEFLAEFDMQDEQHDKDFDIVQFHALQDLQGSATQEQTNEH